MSPTKTPLPFLESLKGPPKVYQYGLRLFQRTGDFKGQISVAMCIRHHPGNYNSSSNRTLLPLLSRDGTDSQNIYNRAQEGGQDPGKGRKGRDKACPDAGCPPGSPMKNPESLKDKAQGKCLICREPAHWAQECSFHDKSPKTICYKCL